MTFQQLLVSPFAATDCAMPSTRDSEASTSKKIEHESEALETALLQAAQIENTPETIIIENVVEGNYR